MRTILRERVEFIPLLGSMRNISDSHGLLYHVTPLQYLPHILQSGALYAKSILAAQGIAPRAGAVRRDRMLGLADWVHLSLRPDTPLLRDKLVKGYPHALLVFDRAAVFSLPDIALLPFNTKAWRTRAACRPITDSAEKAALLQRHFQTGHCPSLEVLVHYGLDLTSLVELRFMTGEERGWVEELLRALALTVSVPIATDTTLQPLSGYQVTTGPAILAYFAACLQVGVLLPPPAIPFD